MSAKVQRAKAASTYDDDFYGWAMEQAALLRERRLAAADIDNIAEEIERLGQSERRELVNRLAVLLAHLLKWEFQPGFRGNSWRLTIEEQRVRLDDHLGENPSLRPKLDSSIAKAYRLAVLAAQKETGLARTVFPQICPYSEAQIIDPTFLPEPDGKSPS